MYKKFLYASGALAALLFVLNQAALNYDLFWRLWWYDIPMHFLGGLVLGCGFAWFFGSMQKRTVRLSDTAAILSILTAVLVGGVAWEIFEYNLDLTYNPHLNYVLDTTKDMIMDMLGASVAIWFYKRKWLSAVHTT